MTLPQFCLKYIESRWVWLGFAPPLPARHVRWSLARVLAFTAGQILVGIAIGWGLALVAEHFIFHRPAGWLIWLSGAYSACQGIVSYGFTALCWNQRAARLQADPAHEPNLRPARYPFFRCVLGSAYFLVLCIITPGAILLTIENVRGEILWRRERAQLLAQGERLEFRAILGPEIPPEQNAGAAPVFAPFFDYQYGQGHAVWRDTNALFQFEERIKFPDKFAPSKAKDAATTPAVDLAGWAEAFQKLSIASNGVPYWAAELKLPADTNHPALVVLAGLAVANQALAELCTASARPRAQFPIHYEEAFDALLRHLGSFKAVQLALERRCAAHLALGEIDAAFADAQCALRVSDLLRGEPLLISQLVRFAQNSLAVRAVWQGLAEHRWMDAQLAEFQADFARRDFFSGLALAFEGERAGCILTVDSWIAGRGNVSNLVGPTESGAPAEFPTAFFSRGMLRQNEIALVRYHGRLVGVLRTAITNAATTGLAATAKAASDNAVLSELAGQQSPYRLLAAMLAPATGNSMNKVVRAQTLEKMAMVACALERHHLKHQVFPETLSALVPEFLSAPPLDPMNNQPFHYQRTEDGWFQLYSVGLNGQDDGGVFKFKKSGSSQEELDWPWPVPSRPQQFNLF